MTVPKLPPFDSNAANTAWRTLKKADGTPYSVFAGTQFPDFVKGLRGQRDVVAAHDVQLGDHKADIDEHSARLADVEQRLHALEVAPPAPFPVSSSGGV